MSKLILSEAQRSQLNGLTEQTEVYDEAGQPLGVFLPREVYRELIAAWSQTWVSEGELEQLSRETSGRTLAEIWKSLGRT
jgi:hypothetical protein